MKTKEEILQEKATIELRILKENGFSKPLTIKINKHKENENVRKTNY